MLSCALLELCGPDASDQTGLRLCAGPFRDLLLLPDPLLSRAPVLFIAPPEYTGPDASDPMVRSFAGDINPAFLAERHVERLVEAVRRRRKGGVT
jgi:hypothetical protein